jgi:hypothetical protein
MNTRQNTNKLIGLAEDGAISWEDIAREALSYMSESEVSDMTAFADLFDEEGEEETEPTEGDYIISDSRGETIITKCEDYHYRKVIKEYSEAYDIIKNEMEREKFWPNVWTLSDHGNYNLISLDSLKEE